MFNVDFSAVEEMVANHKPVFEKTGATVKAVDFVSPEVFNFDPNYHFDVTVYDCHFCKWKCQGKFFLARHLGFDCPVIGKTKRQQLQREYYARVATYTMVGMKTGLKKHFGTHCPLQVEGCESGEWWDFTALGTFIHMMECHTREEMENMTREQRVAFSYILRDVRWHTDNVYRRLEVVEWRSWREEKPARKFITPGLSEDRYQAIQARKRAQNEAFPNWESEY